ncbi:A/G-specific adenine glycosylase [Silvibacterium sp.]|uniref:A/G-specific adenine glycosylase n=1 Tax=Silvibacterium sp. TaxID=1964179 RepID=UPI0039E4D02F
MLLAWFDAHARDLPWRRTRDPYAIWVSEIMLQQTRVAAVIEHYARFMGRFPTLASLALASEDEVLAMWSGLGYYRRARMLHRAAQKVHAELGGVMPRTAEGLRDLPGIGAYTSAAVASIAFGEAAAAVDGNVERVLMRIQGWDETNAPAARLREAAVEFLDTARPGDYNQAMMELGATICLPRGPLCLQCPVQPLCATRGEHVIGERKKMQSKSVSYAFARRRGRVLLSQRPKDASLMPGMWELPPLDAGAAPEGLRVLEVKHAITVTNYTVGIYDLSEAGDMALPGDASATRWFAVSALHEVALTGLARKVLRKLGAFPKQHADLKTSVTDTDQFMGAR